MGMPDENVVSIVIAAPTYDLIPGSSKTTSLSANCLESLCVVRLRI